MRRSLESLLRLLDVAYPAEASAEEFDGTHGAAFRLFQRMGFLAVEPAMNPVPSCPYCVSGTPYLLGARYVCNRCRSIVARRHLHLWRLDLEAFLRWFAGEQHLQGGVERIDDGLWRLGTLESVGHASECFFLRGEGCSELARRRLAAFQSVLVLHGQPEPPATEGIAARKVLIAEALMIRGERLVARPFAAVFGSRRAGAVRFDRRTGVLALGDVPLGRVMAGTREFALLECLAAARGEVIPYADLKRAVCARTGSIDSRDEATFCHRLKSRLKRDHGIAAIDHLIRADRLQGGYALLSEAALPEAEGG